MGPETTSGGAVQPATSRSMDQTWILKCALLLHLAKKSSVDPSFVFSFHFRIQFSSVFVTCIFLRDENQRGAGSGTNSIKGFRNSCWERLSGVSFWREKSRH